jgi:hypothetical protein
MDNSKAIDKLRWECEFHAPGMKKVYEITPL